MVFFLLQMLSKLYMNNAKLVWNGNFVEGITDILEFLEKLPSTETSVDTFDCQPLLGNLKKNFL